MRKIVNTDDINLFRQKFDVLHDAVIKNVTLSLENRFGEFEVLLTVLDLPSNEWVSLSMKMNKVDEFHIRQPLNKGINVISRCYISIFDERVYMNFHPFLLDPDMIETYVPNYEMNSTILVVSGYDSFWEIME